MKADYIAQQLAELQNQICSGLEELDGSGSFHEDQWERPGGGGGRSRVLSGSLIEKGGVNFSDVYGNLPEKASIQLGVDAAASFRATGVSIVLHPRNPFMPIIHMNVRYFEMSDGRWWFGGGIDLTPHYIVQSDVDFFHGRLKAVCDRFDSSWYAEHKAWADRYFYIKHRGESRGVGGIFYDRLSAPSVDHDTGLAYNLAVGQSFVPIYTEMALKHRNKEYGDRQVHWQSMRRSRYVEFNLVWDRGTKFGLETGGRTESILMSMPPMAQWEYNYSPEVGTPEWETQEFLKKAPH